MLAPTHNILAAHASGTSTRRMAIIGSVALLHLAIVYAIVAGMVPGIVSIVEKPIEFRPVKETNVDLPLPPRKPVLDKPVPPVTAPPPAFDTVPDNPQAPYVPPLQPSAPTTQAVIDTAATGVAGTHTTPPYPPLESKLGHEGTVVLQLQISARGTVDTATVVQSSGSAELDAVAVTWVQAHWRYHPAMQGGAAVPSQARAAVRFDLRNARG